MTIKDRVLAPLGTALARVGEEIRHVQTERHAFEGFAERVAALDVHRPLAGPHASRAVHLDGTTPTTTDLRTAYQETVMGVSHYETVYGDSLDNSLAAELGPALASSLETPTALSPALQTAVCAGAHRAATDRAAWLDHLASEQTALEDAQTTLADCTERVEESSVTQCLTTEELFEVQSRLQCVDARVAQVARTRQQQIHDRTLPTHLDGHDIATYLYQEYDWTYPVLTAVSRHVEHLQPLHDTIEWRLNDIEE